MLIILINFNEIEKFICLQRYKHAILETLNLDKKSERDNITDELRRKVKAYGKQANELLLRPEQVFRGFLVSTLECQECHNRSDHVESFLDLSLPVMADKPVHIRSKSYDDGGDINSPPSKHQLKMKRKAAAKNRKLRHNKNVPSNAAGDANVEENNSRNSSDSDNQDQSDADVEDNVEPEISHNQDVIESGYSSEKPFNGDSACGSPSSETNIHFNRDSALASPVINKNNVSNNASNQILDLTMPSNSLSKENLISSPGNHLSITCQPSSVTSSSEAHLDNRLTSNGQDLDSEIKLNKTSSGVEQEELNLPSVSNVNSTTREKIQCKSNDVEDINRTDNNSESDKMTRLENGIGKLLFEPINKEENNNNSNASLYDKVDEDEDGDDYGGSADGTLGQRVCGENSGECTIHSCLNQFTARELMTGNNKVGCEACTKRVNHGRWYLDVPTTDQ